MNFPPPPAVCRAFDIEPTSARLINTGLSGARVWKCRRLAKPGSAWALRQWPRNTSVARVLALHAVQQQMGQHLPLVPQPMLASPAGVSASTVFGWNEHLWECCTWRLGVPMCADQIDDAQLQAVGQALARWHQASWQLQVSDDLAKTLGDSASRQAFYQRKPILAPGWHRRVRRWRQAQSRLLAGCPKAKRSECHALAFRSWHVLSKSSGQMSQWLAQIQEEELLVLALRDGHREHFLFSDGKLTGLIDLGAAGWDSPRVDLARALGSLAPGQVERWPLALDAYRTCWPGGANGAGFSSVLTYHRVSLVLSVFYWWEQFASGCRQSIENSMWVVRWRALLDQLEDPRTHQWFEGV